MTNFGEHFDLTIWDPSNPEEAIEDPVHGAEALIHLLDTPPMPLPDGTYHVFGGFYAIGTNRVDENGKPFIKIGAAASGAENMRNSQLMAAWLETVESGELPDDYPADPVAFFDLAAKPYYIVG